MDAVIKVQLVPERSQSAQEYVEQLRDRFTGSPWDDLEFAFDAGGVIRSVMNEGKSSPINIQITGRDAKRALPVAKAIFSWSLSSSPG
jgi:hypothetical protein